MNERKTLIAATLAEVTLLVAVLAGYLIGPAKEIDRYAKDILDAGMAISSNLDGLTELERTHALATAVPDLAVTYLKKLGAV